MFKFELKPLDVLRQKEALAFVEHYECECVTLTEHLLSAVEDVIVIDAVDTDSGLSYIQALVYYKGNSAVYPCIPFAKNPDFRNFVSKEIRQLIFEFFCDKRIFSITGEIHSVQYLLSVIESPQRPLRNINRYYLMEKKSPGINVDDSVIGEFEVIKANISDRDKLLNLEYQYQIEEVLNGDKSRLYKPGAALQFERVLKTQILYFCQKNGQPICKAGTNACGKSFCQIGGVYCEREFRNKGITSALLQKLVNDIENRGKRVCLFVKEFNESAKKVYEKNGFEYIGNFLIAYFDV